MKWDDATVENMRWAEHQHRMRKTENEALVEESVKFMRGLVIGVAISIPLWCLISYGVWLYITS